jgi:hypothetical protein
MTNKGVTAMTQHIVLKSLEELGQFVDLVLPDN